MLAEEGFSENLGCLLLAQNYVSLSYCTSVVEQNMAWFVLLWRNGNSFCDVFRITLLFIPLFKAYHKSRQHFNLLHVLSHYYLQMGSVSAFHTKREKLRS